MTITPVTAREAMLLTAAHAYGATVHMADLPGTLRGLYDAEHNRIILRSGMTEGQRVSTLAHELIHARRGDNGHQSSAHESRIDEEAAGLLLTAEEYALAERIVGHDSRALAAELDVTPSLVDAWKRRARTRFHS
jgi:hypothetical protein